MGKGENNRENAVLYARRRFKKAQDMRTKAFRFLVRFEDA